jgi:hypothetical protein
MGERLRPFGATEFERNFRDPTESETLNTTQAEPLIERAKDGRYHACWLIYRALQFYDLVLLLRLDSWVSLLAKTHCESLLLGRLRFTALDSASRTRCRGRLATSTGSRDSLSNSR